MKKIVRMFLFSAAALLLTAFWNRGFHIPQDPKQLAELAVIVALLYYVVRPISKVLLLPLNFLSFGLVTLVVFALLFYAVSLQFHLMKISSWTFTGFSLFAIHIPKMAVSQLQNIALSSLSVSFIMSTIEKFI